MKKYFLLYANCVLVRGAIRSTICDLQFNKIHLIPNDLYDILANCKTNTVESVYELYGESNKDYVSEYYEFLLENNLGFYCSKEEVSRFPDLNYSYKTPYRITNSILDIDEYEHNYDSIFSQLELLGCISLQLRFFAAKDNNYIINVLEKLENKRFKSVEIFIKYSHWSSPEEIGKLYKRFLYVTSIVVHSSPSNKSVASISSPLEYARFITDSIIDETHCGFISPSDFAVNIETYSESTKYNSCLNKKVSIDKYGNICNCPAMRLSYGHYEDISISDAISSNTFTAFWQITKDQISICRDCEFRFVCTDCRAITQNTPGDLSKPLRCNYDPYTGLWN